MPLILGTNSIKDTTYDVANSIRLDGVNAYMTRTMGTPTNADKYTFSFWVKRSKLGSQQSIFRSTNGNNDSHVTFQNDDTLRFEEYGGLSSIGKLQTNQVFRDTSAWYHIVLVYDSGNSTGGNRMRMYVNGTEVTDFGTDNNPSQNADSFFNKSGEPLHFGRTDYSGGNNYFSGYLAEVVMCDGQALDPTSFGEFDSDTPTIWKPKDVSGLTFGNNGFYLDFEDSGDLGDDESGNGNDFTESNLTAQDQTTDTCTNNFMTLNPLSTDSGVTLSEGNTESDYDGSVGNAKGNIGLTKGRWYWEVKLTNSTSGYPMVGIGSMNQSQMQLPTGGSYPGGFTDSYGVYGTNLRLYANGSNEGEQGSSYTTGDIFGIYLDLESSTKTIKWYKNGSSVLSDDITNAGSNYPYTCIDYNGGESSVNVNYNFGNPAYSITSSNTDDNGYGNFEYSPNISSTKYYAVCTKNLAEFG